MGGTGRRTKLGERRCAGTAGPQWLRPRPATRHPFRPRLIGDATVQARVGSGLLRRTAAALTSRRPARASGTPTTSRFQLGAGLEEVLCPPSSASSALRSFSGSRQAMRSARAMRAVERRPTAASVFQVEAPSCIASSDVMYIVRIADSASFTAASASAPLGRRPALRSRRHRARRGARGSRSRRAARRAAPTRGAAGSSPCAGRR